MTTEQRADRLIKTLTGKDPGLHIQTCSEAADELRRLSAIEAAAKKLVSAKGRYHTEQSFKALEALINTEGQRAA